MPANIGNKTQIGQARTFGVAQDLIFVSAQSAGTDAKDLALGDQVTAAVARVIAILGEAGAGPTDVAKIGVFYHQSVLDQEKQILTQLRGTFQGKPAPVVTPIPLHNLPEGNLVQIEVIALKPGGRRSAQRRATASNPGNDFSRALRCDDIVFVGAQMAQDAQGATLHAQDIVGQAKDTIANLKSALGSVGADLPAVAKLNTYYIGFGTSADWARAAQVRSDAFTKPGPGATGVPVPGPYPSDLLLRQEAIAIVKEDGTPAHRDTSWPEGTWDWPIKVSFEQGLKINDLLITGGQISASVTGEAVHPNDMTAQATRTMETIANILAGFGATTGDLAKVTVFYATKGDPADIDTVLKAILPFFPKGLPAFTMVPLAKLGLTDLVIEIEGVGAAR